MMVIFVSNFRLNQEDNWVILENKIWNPSDGGTEALKEIEIQNSIRYKYLIVTVCIFGHHLMVRKSQKQIMVSSILPKNEQNSLS